MNLHEVDEPKPRQERQDCTPRLGMLGEAYLGAEGIVVVGRPNVPECRGPETNTQNGSKS